MSRICHYFRNVVEAGSRRCRMTRLVFALIAAASIGAPLAGQQLAGTWGGYWARGGDTLPVTTHVRDSAGTLLGSFDSDRLRVLGIPLSDVELGEGGAVTFRVVGDATTMEFTGSLRGDSLAGTFREANTTGVFAFVRTATPQPIVREVELQVPNGAVTLAGTLMLPADPGPAPVVVFLHGSRAEGRWASRFLATRLAQRGVGAFVYDKRGVGASTGDWRQAGVEDLTGDAAAVIRALAADARVDARRIGLHGHSQGGTLAPMVAARTRVAFVVGSAAAAGPTDSIELFSVLNWVLPRARTAADSADARAFVAEVVAVAYRGRPRARLDSLATAWRERAWMFELPPPGDYYWIFSRSVGDYDALHWWSQVRVPVLLVFGAEDAHVPAKASADRIAAALRAAGNRDVTVHVFPGADHTFRTPPGPGGWASTAPDYLDTLLGWIEARARR
jgi:dipeptidyl aminopeptidase/acylaminoacyl peptidase